MKINCFKEELSYFKNIDIRESAEYLIELLPDYFFKMPASTSGKYHPRYALGDGGLLRHTKVVVKIGNTLLNNNKTIGDKYSSREKDILLLAMIMHDGFKKGLTDSPHTKFEHPIISRDVILENVEKLKLSPSEVTILTNSISSHMGEWNCANYSSEVLPVPESKYERFVHMCDYLASQKFLEVSFNENNDIIS